MRKWKFAFTLVELIVTLLIIGTLIGFAVPRYMESQATARANTFVANVREIKSALEAYRASSGVGEQLQYPASLTELQEFTKKPINPYTNKTMLSDDPLASGIVYSSDGLTYSLCIAQQDIDDINKNNIVDEPLPMFADETCDSQIVPIANGKTITLIANPVGAGSPTATPNPAILGATVTLIPTPSSCYEFSSWSSSDVTVSNDQFVMPEQNVTVTANYIVKQYNVSVTSNNTAYGTVTGSGVYGCGSTAVLTATPKTGYKFVGWYENNNETAATTTYSFVVTSSRTIVAKFAINITITFTRNSVAYTSNGMQIDANTPRYETGKFGQGIFIEEGTINLLTANQSSVETDSSGLEVWTVSGDVIDIERDTTTAWHGNVSAKSNQPVEFGIRTTPQPTSTTAGIYYTGSVYAKSSNPQTAKLQIWFLPSNTSFTVNINLTTSWTRFSVTRQAPSGTTSVYIQLISAPNNTIWWDGAQLEPKMYATSWILGGTIRDPETLTVAPVSSLFPVAREGTIELWVYIPEFWQTSIPNWRRIWSISDNGAPGMFLLMYDSRAYPPPGYVMRGSIVMSFTSKFGVVQNRYLPKPSVGWHHFAVRWTYASDDIVIFQDGVRMIGLQYPAFPDSFPSNILSIGGLATSSSGPTISDNIGTTIDDIRISNRARSDQEIRTLYQSGQPAPVDAWTVLKLDFNSNLNQAY